MLRTGKKALSLIHEPTKPQQQQQRQQRQQQKMITNNNKRARKQKKINNICTYQYNIELGTRLSGQKKRRQTTTTIEENAKHEVNIRTANGSSE